MRNPRVRRTSAANRVPLFSLLAAELISSVGNFITTLAVPWFVLVTTGSAARAGLTDAAMAIGGVLTAALGRTTHVSTQRTVKLYRMVSKSAGWPTFRPRTQAVWTGPHPGRRDAEPSVRRAEVSR
jgi:hypothetical protein